MGARAGDLSRVREVVSKELGLLSRELRHHALEDLADPAVQLRALTRADGFVDVLPEQRLPEAVIAMRRGLQNAARGESGEARVRFHILTEECAQQRRLRG